MLHLKPGAIVFDLDGTLWDTSETCAAAWNAVVARLGVAWRTVTAADVRRVTGQPHQDAIDSAFAGLDRATLDALGDVTQTEDNRFLARQGGILYPGVRELIPHLAQRHPLYIVSNCQAGYIEAFREFSGLHPYFTDHECWGRTGEAKPANLQRLLGRNATVRAVMVGDTEGDAEAARFNRLPFVHAAYGFGSVARADATLASFVELPKLLERL